MKKNILFTTLLALVAVGLASPAFAADGAGSAGAVSYYSWAVIVAGFAMAFASSICALGQGKAIAAAMEGIARQPSAAGKIQVNLIIGLALIESLAIYTLVVALIIFFVNPFGQFIG